VAFVPPVQLARNELELIKLMLIIGTVGAGGSVVRLVVDDVSPVEFTADITREYVVLGFRPIKLAVLLRTPASVEGVTDSPSIEYVYEVALKAPVQVAVNELSLRLVIVITGAVGGKIKVLVLTVDEAADVLYIEFTAVTTKKYAVSGESPVKVAVFPTTLGVKETVFSVNVYPVESVPPVHVATNELLLIEPTLTIGGVGVIIVFG
jgi:hypothetical protein